MSKGAETRKNILQEAFNLIYINGFQSTSIDEILKKTNVTKGSFFHHFNSKEEMGLAMINEIMYPGMYAAMVEPLVNGERPLDEIYEMMQNLLMKNPVFEVKYGCPAINLIDEMAQLSEPFSQSLLKLSKQWEKAISNCLNKAQVNLMIDSIHQVDQITTFIISGYSGIRILGKMYGRSSYTTYLAELKRYLEGL